eukprot:111753-Pleurochrysis_carterae.AAC.2
MMWVLRKKKDEKGELLKYKARAVVCGNQLKRKALAAGTEHTLETSALAARSATFKLLCAVGCIANVRVRQFDVEATHLHGKLEGDNGEVYVRPPPDERFFDDRDGRFSSASIRRGRRGSDLAPYCEEAARASTGIHAVGVRPELLLQNKF